MEQPKLYFILLWMICITSPIFAQKHQKLDSLFNTLDTARKFNGNVLVAEKNKVVYSRSVGFSQLNTPKRNTVNSAFQIGSVSKTFTATAVLQLVQQGKVHPDDPLTKYFPDFPYKNITVRHLLSHTSGLPDKEELFFPLIDADSNYMATNDSIIPALKRSAKPLAFAPGGQWRYNNLGFAILALLVEKVSGQSFADYLHRHIFLPAGMKSSYLLGSKPVDADQVTGYIIRHHYMDDLEPISSSKKVRRWSYNLRLLYGPTNIVSTTGDLMKFAAALDANKLLNRRMLDTMFTPFRFNDGSKAMPDGEFGSASYGLGWFLPELSSLGKIVMHTGREPGFFTFFWHDSTHQRTVILLDNAESTGFGLACKEVLNLVYGQEIFKKEPEPKRSLFKPYIKKLLESGPDAAAVLFNRLKSDTLHYFMDERELNELGLELLEDHHEAAAREALKNCTLLYPQSWNTYDSYGKALLQAGKKQEAMDMYRKSVEMFPGNLPGKKILEKLIESH
ncbi:beta-lactamase family protein [Mucilaginibacter sp. RS28]|uniref:Beta-lactamase family protein n=1 Tax=Mucilaginibacter straminoryzae TaxID=2932774 RepID=A0A9X1X617_9SPHI|nr:serine hydrolase domain-containing protein [Mucilaginibacter straminoryzae]MCJ8211206.1 beta-lactamase family protein [Mucilaginibacter straminoryzae]